MSDGPEQIAQAITRLKRGRLVAFPTETVYGLGADALDPDAVARVFEAKRRPANNPLIVHVSDEAMAEPLVAEWTDAAHRLAGIFWPGPLTIVLKKSALIPDIVTAGGDTVALRSPDHTLTLALIEALGRPLVGPSANPSGYVSPTTPAHVRVHFSPDEVQVLDGGPCRVGIESTVVDLTGPRPVILRPGVIGADRIAAVLGITADQVQIHAHERTPSGATRSPGVVGSHYQPRVPVQLAESYGTVSAWVEQADTPVGVICAPGVPLAVSPPHLAWTMPLDALEYARELYAVLREADDSGITQLTIVRPSVAESEDPSAWNAVLERLERIASRPHNDKPR